MYRIGRSLFIDASFEGHCWDTTSCVMATLNPDRLSLSETVSDGSLIRRSPPKGNGGAQKVPQNGWKSFAECKGIRELTASYNSSRTKVGLSDLRFRGEGPRQRDAPPWG